MKITYLVLNAYVLGGTIRTVFNQANALVARGHEVEIGSMHRRKDDTVFPLDDRVRLVPIVDVRPEVPRGPYDLADEDTSWHGHFPAGVSGDEESRRRVSGLINYLREPREGVLVSTRPTINLVVERYADPALVRVIQEHSHLSAHKGEWREAIDRAYPSFDALVTLTEDDHAAYTEAFGDSLRIGRIPNALHSLDVPRSDQSRKIVVAAGRLDKNKGFHLLVEAFEKVIERHPDWTLRIIGDGPEEKRLRAMVLKRHLYNHVYVMGPSDRLDQELAKASIFAMSSRSEGFGMVLLEALNCGLSVVSFDCPVGPREILTNEVDGLLVPTGDVTALAEGIARLIEDEPLRQKLRTAGLETAAGYGPEPIVDQWERLFTDLLAVKARASGVAE
ncbi:glycosyltransferase family 4 protein [Actinomadura fulvescens]|uniref:Glycosyl transferase family 1 domain-containing protein n=1 Tax=Actinomadura fulvescens TaxID=46160 RepID=A0ABP6CQA9_9ACTN